MYNTDSRPCEKNTSFHNRIQSENECPRYIMRFAICTALFSRLGLLQYGVMGLKWACGVNLVRLSP